MADLSKIKLNGTEYDLKDNAARIANTEIIGISLSEGEYFAYDRQNNDITSQIFTYISNKLDNNIPVLLYFRDNCEFYLLYFYYKNSSIVFQTTQNSGAKNILKSITISSSNSISSSSKSHYRITSVSYPLSFNTSTYQLSLATSIPTLEPMANVEAMLTSYGLNANANLQSAAAGTAEIGKAVVQ